MKISNPPVVELNAYSATQGKFVCIMINLVTIEFNREESQLRFCFMSKVNDYFESVMNAVNAVQIIMLCLG